MRNIPKTERIADMGLRVYLDKTKPEHNNLDYDNFVSLLENEVNKANLARAFGVNRDTIYRWIRLYEKEQRGA